ncbi:chromate transporter, partial [Deinococcus xianganensis]
MRALEVFTVFLRLGLSSFGGPVAHLGFFRAEFVERRAWLGDAEYAELVAVANFLPGPSSSQVGLAVGLHRAGWVGAGAAWLGFTLPSALLMALLGGTLAGSAADGAGWVQGVKLAAVAVVAQAVAGMWGALVTDRVRAGLALGAA